MGNKQPSWGAFWRDTTVSTLQSWLLLLALGVGVLGIVGLVALFDYIRSEGVLVPALSALAGSVILLLLGSLVYRPLVWAGYTLLGLAIWLPVTGLVLRLYAFGTIIGLLGVVVWLLVTAVVVVLVVAIARPASPEEQAALEKQADARWGKFFAPLADERRVYSPQTCWACGAALSGGTVVKTEVRTVREPSPDAPKQRPRLVAQVAERRLCGCGQQTTATFPS